MRKCNKHHNQGGDSQHSKIRTYQAAAGARFRGCTCARCSGCRYGFRFLSIFLGYISRRTPSKAYYEKIWIFPYSIWALQVTLLRNDHSSLHGTNCENRTWPGYTAKISKYLSFKKKSRLIILEKLEWWLRTLCTTANCQLNKYDRDSDSSPCSLPLIPDRQRQTRQHGHNSFTR